MSEPCKKRRPRPLTSDFDPNEMYELWKPRASVKDPGFKWDGSSYSNLSRNSQPNQAGLCVYKGPLQELLSKAPTGLPSHPALRETFLKLHDKHTVFDVSDRFVFKAATESSDAWRIMTKDIYDLKKDGVSVLPELKPLIDLIVLRELEPIPHLQNQIAIDAAPRPDQVAQNQDLLPHPPIEVASRSDNSSIASSSVSVPGEHSSSAASSSGGSAPGALLAVAHAEQEQLNADAVARRFAEMLAADSDCGSITPCALPPSDSDVEICKIVCNCKECVPPPVIASAAIGGQRRETAPPKETAPKETAPKKTNPLKETILSLKTRLRKKTTVAQKVVPEPVKKTKKSKKNKGIRDQRLHDPIILPCKLRTTGENALTKNKEAWIEQNSWKHRYIVGQTKNKSANYVENIQAVLKGIEDQQILTRADAKDALATLMQRRGDSSTDQAAEQVPRPAVR